MSAASSDHVLGRLADVRPWMEETYRDLHQHPELSHAEVRTAGVVARRLRTSGVEVHEGVGGTGVVGIVRNGDGPVVLLRADMDALPVREATGLPYASTVTAPGPDGTEVPVMHACGHDVHVACLLGAVDLLASAPQHWNGTVVAVFQPAEEPGDGAARMVEDGLVDLVGSIDVALGQHVLALPSGTVATRPGSIFSAADNLRITVHGRGGHGAMPHAAVDPVVLAASIVLRLQAVVSRETKPGDPVILTIGSIQAGTRANIIPDAATLLVNVRTYSEETRAGVLAAISRIVEAECAASGSPRAPELEAYDQFSPTTNDAEVTARVADAFASHFGDAAGDLPLQFASEDFSVLPRAFGAPYTYWGVGGIDPQAYAEAEAADRIAQDVATNHSPLFAPAVQPTLDSGASALVVAALAWLGGRA